MYLNRRQTIILAAAAGASTALPAFADDGDLYDVAKLMAPTGWTDHIYGNPDSKAVFIEYLSPTCPHCAKFATEVYPPLKEKYVDTNLIAFVPRPFARNIADVAVFLLAEAAGDDKFLDVVDTYFKTQGEWATSDKLKDAILEIAKQLGFTEETFNAALTNQGLVTGIEAVRKQALEEFGLTGTPTFYLSGKQLSGEKTLEDLSTEIDPLLA